MRERARRARALCCDHRRAARKSTGEGEACSSSARARGPLGAASALARGIPPTSIVRGRASFAPTSPPRRAPEARPTKVTAGLRTRRIEQAGGHGFRPDGSWRRRTCGGEHGRSQRVKAASRTRTQRGAVPRAGRCGACRRRRCGHRGPRAGPRRGTPPPDLGSAAARTRSLAPCRGHRPPHAALASLRYGRASGLAAGASPSPPPPTPNSGPPSKTAVGLRRREPPTSCRASRPSSPMSSTPRIRRVGRRRRDVHRHLRRRLSPPPAVVGRMACRLARERASPATTRTSAARTTSWAPS